MLPNPGLRRRNNGGNPGGGIPANATTFIAPLTMSLLPSRAVGSSTPTFSRASTAYVQDHEGLMRACLANEARFWGARRAANFYLRSQEMAHVAWTNLAMTVTAGDADPFGGTAAQRLTGDGVATPHQMTQFVGGTALGNTFTMSRYLKTFDGTDAHMFLLDGASAQGVLARINLNTGAFVTGPTATGAATNAQGQIVPVPGKPGWYRCWLSCTFGAGAAVNPNACVGLQDGSAVNLSNAQGIVCYGNMLENVTGQSVVTPSEYVSTNVLSSPFQGANVDGVQYFDTTLAGAPIPATTLLGYFSEAAGTQLVTPTAAIRNMTDASWTLGATMARAFTSTGIDGVANSATRLTGGAVAATNIITQTLVAAATSRTYSAWIRRVTGTGPVRLTQDNFVGGSDISSQLVAGVWKQVQFNASILNAVYGIKIDTNTDAIDVDFNGFEAGAAATSPMATTGASRYLELLTYPLAGNANNVIGTMYCEMVMTAIGNVTGGVGNGAYLAQGAISVYNYDGVNFLNAAAAYAANTKYKIGSSWGASTKSIVQQGLALASGVFDNDMGATAISVGGPVSFGQVIANLRIYSQKLTDAQLTAMVV